ncbi:inositol monophosphatase [Staphylococcus devriesei]|nr:inositol monophosphatase [Staphylococcus devriesei]
MSLYDFAKGLVLEAGNNVRTMMKDELNIETKSNPNDLVTNVDKATENYIYDAILRNYPDHQVIGEEGHGHHIENIDGVVWVVDPIDGTLNFVHQKENFAISIGIYRDGQPYAGLVYDVMKDVLYHAKVGEGAFENKHPLQHIEDTVLKQSLIGINPNWVTKPKIGPIFSEIVNQSRSCRAYGSAALEIISVAKGQLATYMTPRLQPWDFAGGLIILDEVGGVSSNLLGEKLTIASANSVIIGNKQVHQEILQNYLKPHSDVLTELHQRFRK